MGLRILSRVSVLLVVCAAPAFAQQVDWKAADEAMGRSGTMESGGVHKYSMPRSDLHVTVQGVVLKPALALGSWLAMEPRPDGKVIAMGDLVLTESEVNPVMLSLQQSGVMQTALHNHLLFESPRVMFMHVHGEGNAAEIARAVRQALMKTATPMASAPAGGAAVPIGLDTAAIARALGHHGSVSGGVYKVSIPRAETIRSSGIEVPPSMGTAIGIGFQPTGGGKAAIAGDFVLLPAEVNPVIRALRENGILVAAVHNHMLFDEPHLVFMHFWANDDAMKLARGLRAALDHMATKGGP